MIIVGTRLKRFDIGKNLGVVFANGLAKLIVHLQRLAKVEKMLRAPVAGQFLGNLLF